MPGSIPYDELPLVYCAPDVNVEHLQDIAREMERHFGRKVMLTNSPIAYNYADGKLTWCPAPPEIPDSDPIIVEGR